MALDLLAQARWQVARFDPGDHTVPAHISAQGQWLPATVPGTAAGALRDAGHDTDDVDFDASDWWFRTQVTSGGGEHVLAFAGLATVADVWLDDTHILHSESMFCPHELSLDLAPGTLDLAIRFSALGPLLRQKRPRGRWRSGLVTEQSLRWWRTTLLGRMPGWAGSAQPVGPWRAVTLQRRRAVEVIDRTISAAVGTGGECVVDVRLDIRSDEPIIGASITAGPVTVAAALGTNAGVTTLAATVLLPDAQLWWPHTHGSQPLYDVAATIRTTAAAETTIELATVGFRSVAVDTEDGAFTLAINGAPLFARGACWLPPDPISLNPAGDLLRQSLEQYVDAGFNVVRVTGTTVYETPQFWRLCAELGLMVWQDCMFATLDPPADPEFEAAVVAELTAVFTALQGCPAIAVISGGSESEQQPAMLGLPAERRGLPLLEVTIRELAAGLLPGVPYVTSSPTGGTPPTRVDTGVSHYFGVGAYLRPLSDSRTAGVRFAAECLAFAIPPERATVAAFTGSASAGHDPRWKAGVPRDHGSAWDFEDVREHYVGQLFGVEPAAVRRDDPDRALDLGRAAVAQLLQDVFAEWRRTASPCAGGIVLSMRDLMPGAGWGLIDSTGVPKAPWYAAARVLAPVAVFVTDEGLDGVAIHVANDRQELLAATLRAQLYGTNGLPLELVSVPLQVAARSGQTLSLMALLGEFRDVNHAYRFGPAAYDALHVTLTDEAGAIVSEVTHLLRGQVRPDHDEIGLTALLATADDSHTLTVKTRDLAQWISIDCPGFQPSDSWFHLPPGGSRTIVLRATRTADQRPSGTVRAINSRAETFMV